MQITAIIIDDQVSNIELLQNKLKRYFPEVSVVATANNPDAGLEVIRKHRPMLVFLDIEMPEYSGIEMLKRLGNINFQVVFVTAHDKYAVQAFRLSALDYLMKPIDLTDLEGCIEKVRLKLENKQELVRLAEFVQQFPAANQQTKKVPIATAQRLSFVNMSEIIRCEGENNYTTIHLKNGDKHVVSKTLKDYERMLEPFEFMRVHQSHLVNMQHVDKYERGEGGYLVMTDGSNVPISRARKEKTLSYLTRF